MTQIPEVLSMAAEAIAIQVNEIPNVDLARDTYALAMGEAFHKAVTDHHFFDPNAGC